MPSHGDPCSSRQDTSSAGRTTSDLSASAIPEALRRRTLAISLALLRDGCMALLAIWSDDCHDQRENKQGKSWRRLFQCIPNLDVHP